MSIFYYTFKFVTSIYLKVPNYLSYHFIPELTPSPLFYYYIRYAKWRASYLLDCLNTGKEPSDPGPKPANSTPVFQDSASASQNSLSPQRQLTFKSEPMELAQQFCKKVSKALALKDISSAKDNLTAAIILYKRQKKVRLFHQLLLPICP